MQVARPQNGQRKCKDCGNILFNRQSHAKYCRKCSDAIRKKKFKNYRKLRIISEGITEFIEIRGAGYASRRKKT